MSVAPLCTPKPPVLIIPGHTCQEETSFTVTFYDKAFAKPTEAVLAASGTADKTIFHIEGTAWGTSWSLRRKVYGAGPPDSNGGKGAHLFDFRHHSLDTKNGWVVEAAGDGRKLATLVHQDFLTKKHSDVNATVLTTAGEHVRVVMRDRGGGAGDDSAAVVDICVGDETFATIEKVENNKSQVGIFGTVIIPISVDNEIRSVWRARAAAGVDLSLVMVMLLCRAEMGHIWGQ